VLLSSEDDLAVREDIVIGRRAGTIPVSAAGGSRGKIGGGGRDRRAASIRFMALTSGVRFSPGVIKKTFTPDVRG
jgi:hypothetical protein